ncbi:ricin-type beta-trefoil lectin domain protein [Actinoplanes sp. NPDC049668]|uniref:RICIN domain-containing protein n=1 Tax=unclassified Actinoplanes TaxID=2626549 RepID=UPI0033B93B4A
MRFLRWPGPRHDTDDRGSLPLAMLLTTVVMGLSAVMVPIVVLQAGSTATVSSRNSALDAARSGIDVALGQIRTSLGDYTKLPPCEMASPAGTNPPYTVSIRYFGASGADLGCPPNAIPVTAQLSVTGTGASDTRTLNATYTFKTTNENISGGNIRLDQPTSPYLCMDSGGTRRPAVGAAVKMEECERKLDSKGKLVYTISTDQRFAYTEFLYIKLVNSESPTALNGMCLDAPIPRKSGDLVTFKPCEALKTARQQWSLDNSSNFRSTTNGVDLDSFCLNLSTPGKAGGSLVIGACGGGADQRVFRPQASVGAGMAAAKTPTGESATGQLINFKQFSRCLDVTNHDVNMSYMIVWFCKQAPNGDVSWNQRWTMPKPSASETSADVGRIRTTGTSSPGVCLRSPLSTAVNRYVTVKACATSGTLDNDMKWKILGDTGTYATSYTVVDFEGNCLTPTDLTVDTPDTHGDGTAKTKVAACDGSLLQKWNAPANLTDPDTLTNTVEK